jgi:hypothetical protein
MTKRYTVIWRRSLIETTLAQFTLDAWQKGDDLNAITQAVAEIDRRLSAAPHAEGESRPPFERILIIPPLSVSYEIHEEERTVLVLRARYCPRRR